MDGWMDGWFYVNFAFLSYVPHLLIFLSSPIWLLPLLIKLYPHIKIP